MFPVEDFSFVLIFLLAGGLIYFLLRIAGERLTQVTVISFLFLCLFVFSYIGIAILYFQLDEYRVWMGVDDEGKILRLFILECLALVSLLAGVIVARRPGLADQHAAPSGHCRPSLGLETLVLFAWLLLSLGWFAAYLAKVDSLAIFVSFLGNRHEVNLARSAMGNDFSGAYHWYRVFMLDIGSFVAFAFFSNWLVTRRFRDGLLFVGAFSYAAFCTVMAAEKAPFMYLVIGMFFCHAMIRHGGALKLGRTMSLGAVLVSVLVVFYLGFMDIEDVRSAIWSVFSRVFGQIVPAYFYVDYVPAHRDYYLGATLPNPRGIFPFEPQRHTVEIMNWVLPEEEKTGVVGSMPTVFWAEAYVNFGIAGVLIVPFVVGMLLAFLSAILRRLEPSPAAVAYTVWVVIHYAMLSSTGFSSYMFDMPLVVLTMALLSVIFLRGRGRLFAAPVWKA